MAKRSPKVVQLKISIVGIAPQIWRRIVLSTDSSLHELHRIIQLLFEWYDYHLYEFTIENIRYQAPGPESEGEDSTRARLSKFHFSVGDEFNYSYDFGDDWCHQIEVENLVQKVDPGWLPHVVDGERRGPPEDCGGVGGFERFMQSIDNPEDPEHDEYRRWVGEDYYTDEFDLRTVRHAVLLATGWGNQSRDEL